jgi:hypothetical protein
MFVPRLSVIGISAELPEVHVWKFTTANYTFVSSFLFVLQSVIGYIIFFKNS